MLILTRNRHERLSRLGLSGLRESYDVTLPAHEGRPAWDGNYRRVNEEVDIYLYSAFWDDRPTVANAPVIRVLAAVQKLYRGPPRLLHCVLTCSGDTKGSSHHHFVSTPTDKLQIATYKVLTNREGRYGRFLVTCSPGACTKYFSIIRASLSYLEPENQPAGQQLNDSNSVPVEFPLKPRNVIDFGTCHPIAFGHLDPYRLVEWFEMQKLLGIGRVVMYNDTLDESSSAVLFHYGRQGYLDIRQTRPLMKTRGTYNKRDYGLRMGLSTTDCLYRYLYTFKNIISMDADELIVPRSVRTLPELWAIVKRTKPFDVDVASLKFQNVNWPADPGLKADPDKDKPFQLHYMRYRNRQHVNPIGYHMKHVVDPMGCAAFNQHRCMGTVEGYETLELWVNATLGTLHHYRGTMCNIGGAKHMNCSDPNHMVISDDMMLRYEDHLTKAVNQQLRELGLQTITWYTWNRRPTHVSLLRSPYEHI